MMAPSMHATLTVTERARAQRPCRRSPRVPATWPWAAQVPTTRTLTSTCSMAEWKKPTMISLTRQFNAAVLKPLPLTRPPASTPFTARRVWVLEQALSWMARLPVGPPSHVAKVRTMTQSPVVSSERRVWRSDCVGRAGLAARCSHRPPSTTSHLPTKPLWARVTRLLRGVARGIPSSRIMMRSTIRRPRGSKKRDWKVEAAGRDHPVARNRRQTWSANPPMIVATMSRS